MTQPEDLKALLNAVSLGAISPEDAIAKLKHFSYERVGDFAHIDHHRALRTGFPEVIWGPGKTPQQIAQIMEAMRNRTSTIMATRIELDVYEAIQTIVPDVHYYATARICALKSSHSDQNSQISGTMQSSSPSGVIGILSAGTADLPVAEEAAVTAELCGFNVQRLWDVGVAGIHRLLNNLHVLNDADVLIVVAGMEGALPSVVGGLADCPIVAVPTSVGYGASFNGLAPLLTMLNSCAAGIGVVNIDNGFGAAVLAGQILRTAAKLKAKSEKL